MNTRWEKAKIVFGKALELPPADRELFLQKTCAGDEELLNEVESLLESFVDDSFLETPAWTAEKHLGDPGVFASGKILNQYEVDRQLGAGGMGEVYLATDTRLHRRVALKFLPAEFMFDLDRVRRFEQEAIAASALNHPNILTIYEIGEFENSRFIASEFIEGQTLRERLAHKSLPFNEAVDISVQTVSALTAAHESGIVHRDVKPENIMIRRDRLVKVLDFGLAKLAAGESLKGKFPRPSRNATAAGTIMGTTAYMSPEQARGSEIDARSDIFSFGIVLYEMLTGGAPFVGESTDDIIAAILKQEPIPVGDRVPGIPPELQQIVEKALRKDRSDRYQHTKNLLTDLREIKQDLEFTLKTERGAANNARSGQTETTRIQSAVPTSSAEYLVGRLRDHKLALFAFLLFMAAGVAALLNLAWSDPSNGVTGDAVDSIAVLPFENGAQDENAEYLSDGISESLINRLSQLSGLRVMSSNAVLRYKGKKPHAMEVAGELNVRAVLTGSVKQVGDQLVINVSLDDTKDNRRIWGENYSRKLTDVLAVQSEIAHEVASNLRLKLTGSDERQLTKRYTESVEAYQLYLKGNYHWKKYTREDSQKGIDYYNQAILVDPNYAMAYTGLANSYGVMALAFLPPEEGFSKAKYYAGKALELDETLSDAHSSMGAVRLFYDWDWVEAEKELTTALELDPDHFDANIVYPAFLESMGRFDESRPLAVGAQRREPLSAWTNTQLGIDLYLSRRYDASVAQLEKTISIEPRYLPAYLQLGQAYIQKKMYTRAIETFQKGIDQAGPDPHLIALRGHAYALAGELDNARQALDELNAMSKSAYVSSYFFAVVHAGTGDTDQTFEWLEKAYQERYFMLIRLKVEPLFDPLRSDARFHNLLKRMNFPG